MGGFGVVYDVREFQTTRPIQTVGVDRNVRDRVHNTFFSLVFTRNIIKRTCAVPAMLSNEYDRSMCDK